MHIPDELMEAARQPIVNATTKEQLVTHFALVHHQVPGLGAGHNAARYPARPGTPPAG